MSSNKIYDEIEDELIKAFEQSDKFPEEFTVRITKDQMEALLDGGLYLNEKKLPNHLEKIRLTVADHRVTFTVDTYEN